MIYIYNNDIYNDDIYIYNNDIYITMIYIYISIYHNNNNIYIHVYNMIRTITAK